MKASRDQPAMPARHSQKQDPFHRIRSWDDGYEYIREMPPSPPQGRAPAPFFSPPPKAAPEPPWPAAFGPEPSRKPARTDNEPYARPPYPSPPSDSDGHARRSRRRRAPSPSPRRPARFPSPARRRDVHRGGDRDARHPPTASWQRPRRPSLETRSTAPLPNARSTRDAPAAKPYSRSPSPSRTRERNTRDHRDDKRRPERRRSPPLPLGGHYRDSTHRDYSPGVSPTNDRHKRSARHRSPSPPLRSTAKDEPHRPSISRSKTTSARDRLAGLSPRWQQAATAAFQAGSMAAFNMRSQPGAWKGEKGARVATAALSAAAMDALNKKEERRSGGTSKGGAGGGAGGRRNGGVEALGGALSGFLADQFVSKRDARKGKSKH